MIIQCTAEKKIFAVVVYKLLVQKKCRNSILNIALELMENMIKMTKKGEYVKFSNCKREINHDL